MTESQYGDAHKAVIDPMKFLELCWPDVRLYDKQVEIIYSVRDNIETVVPAGNGLGKDFISGFIALWFFCSRRPARVVTTSVKYEQLNDVLWGEMRRWIETSKFKLPIHYNHMKIRQKREDGTLVPLSELIGQVVNKGESMLGRHLPQDIPRTLVIFDEASGIDDSVYETADTWAHRKLVIGNCYPTTNFFFKGVQGGDLKLDGRKNFQRKVIRIKAEDSPNVKYGFLQKRNGMKPDGTVLIPGVVDYLKYEERRAIWDPMRQSIGLDAEFYEGAEIKMYPAAWLVDAQEFYRELITSGRSRIARAIGIDPAEGGDSTVWTVIDEFGIIEQISKKTPDTSKIAGDTIYLMNEYRVPAEKVCFDRGGGGKQHADNLRSKGFNVQTVAFGEPVKPGLKRGTRRFDEKVKEEEERYVYKNRRAEMAHMLRLAIDPNTFENEGRVGFAIPPKCSELIKQLRAIPLRIDGEGRIYLPPKNKKNADSNEECLVDLIGHSPDEWDSLMCANHILHKKPSRSRAGAV